MKKSKKFLALLLAVVMIVAAVPLTVFATTSSDFEYEVLEDGTAEITKYTGSAKKVDIPSKLDGYTVTGIGNDAFNGCASLKNVTFPNSITRIGIESFRECKSLTDVNIPDSVTSIDDYAFLQCLSLKEINIPDSVTFLGQGVFQECTSLKSAVIGNEVTNIGYFTFGFCTSLENVKIGSRVTSVYNVAFAECPSLKSIIIPKNVTKIGIYAFGYTYKDRFQEIPEIKVPNFTIYGEKGTVAEKYANDNGFKFIEIGSSKPGDLDGDNIIGASDAIMIQRYVAGIGTLSAEQLKSADLNKDGIVDEADAIKILRIDAGLEK